MGRYGCGNCNTDGGYFYKGIIANAWARNTNVTKLAVKIFVLDASTGAVKTSVTMTSQGSVSGLSSYYSGSLYVYYDQVTSDKTQILLYSSNGITSRSTSTTTKNGSTYYKTRSVDFAATIKHELDDMLVRRRNVHYEIVAKVEDAPLIGAAVAAIMGN